MKTARRTAFAALSLLLTLTSCASDADSAQTNQAIPQDTSSDMLIEYYEGRIDQLENSILSIKEEYFISERGYISAIEKLESDISKFKEQMVYKKEDNHQENISYAPFLYEAYNGGIKITKYTGNSERISVPSKASDSNVKCIGERSFPSSTLTVILSDGIEEIDWFAFSDCTQMREIYIPPSVKKIGYGAFDGCPDSLIIRCRSGSYAEAYAKSFALSCIAE